MDSKKLSKKDVWLALKALTSAQWHHLPQELKTVLDHSEAGLSFNLQIGESSYCHRYQVLWDQDLLSKQASRFALKAKGFFLHRILFVTYLYLFEWKLFYHATYLCLILLI
jgi:hypothetical protein